MVSDVSEITIIPVAPAGYRSGFVGIIGRPNVGKSTLMNQMVGQKIAITSPVAQTTRNRLRGILTLDRAQIIFVDTPGMKAFYESRGYESVWLQSSFLRQRKAETLLEVFDESWKHGLNPESYHVTEIRRLAKALKRYGDQHTEPHMTSKAVQADLAWAISDQDTYNVSAR